MATLDLHVHTTYSDGTWTPEAVVEAAARRGVTLIAITDHDEVDGIAPAQEAGQQCGVTVLSGVEINTDLGREDVHVLGYGFPPASAIMREGLQHLRASRLERLLKMRARLADLGMPLEEARLLDIAGHGSVGRPHLAHAMVEVGYVPDIATAFDRWLRQGRPAYVARSTFRPEEAVELIHRAGGVAVLAHPGKLGDPPRIIRRLMEVGLDGLEAWHCDHTPQVNERMARYARQAGLGVTAGSDSHGPTGPRPLAIGAVPVPPDEEMTIRAWLVAKGLL